MQSRGMRVLVGVVAGLVLLAVGAGVFSAVRPAAELPEGSPERAVQDYVQALYDDDLDTATSYLDPDEGCTTEDLDVLWVDGDARVVLRDTRVDGDEATVRIELVHADSGPVAVDEWSEEETFRLRSDVDGWVLTGLPWPLHRCTGDGESP